VSTRFSEISRLKKCIRILGWSAISGVIVIILAYVLNYPLATYDLKVWSFRFSIHLVDMYQITRETWKAKDRRMNVVNELLQNIRFLKFYGWGR